VPHDDAPVADVKRVKSHLEGSTLSRNYRLLIPIAYGLAVAFVGLFANKAVAVTVTVAGAIVLGVAYALGLFRDPT
jgi:hypothetical protein